QGRAVLPQDMGTAEPRAVAPDIPRSRRGVAGEGGMTGAAPLSQIEIDRLNREFWNELCGTQLATSLGITDHSPESLARFDDWYLGLYPYLYRHLPFAEMTGQNVLEIGLGYGTVAQKIAAAGAHYHGLDIA